MDDLHKLWEMAQHAGPFSSALLFYLYWDERKERREKDKELKNVLVNSIEVIKEIRTTMDTWLAVFHGGEK